MYKVVAFCLLRTVFVFFLILFLLVLEKNVERKLSEVVSKKRQCFFL